MEVSCKNRAAKWYQFKVSCKAKTIKWYQLKVLQICEPVSRYRKPCSQKVRHRFWYQFRCLTHLSAKDHRTLYFLHEETKNLRNCLEMLSFITIFAAS